MRILLLALCLLSTSVFASDIVLKNGQTVSGQIIENTDKEVRLISDVGTAVTYYKDEIASIDGQNIVANAVAQAKDIVAPSIPEAAAQPTPVEAPAANGYELPSANADLPLDSENAQQALTDNAQDVANAMPENLNQDQNIAAVQDAPAPEAIPVAPAVAEQQNVPQPVATTPAASQVTVLTNADLPQDSRVTVGNPQKVFDPSAKETDPMVVLKGFIFIFAIMMIVFLIFGTIFCLGLQKLVKKHYPNEAWMAWVPIAMFYVMCKLAGRPGWWVILCFIPFVNIIIDIVVWYGMCEREGKSGWLGLLVVIPFGSIILVWMLANAQKEDVRVEVVNG